MIKLTVAFFTLAAFRGICASPVPQFNPADALDSLFDDISGPLNNINLPLRRDSSGVEEVASAAFDFPDIKGYLGDLVDKYFNGPSDDSQSHNGVLLKRQLGGLGEDINNLLQSVEGTLDKPKGKQAGPGLLGGVGSLSLGISGGLRLPKARRGGLLGRQNEEAEGLNSDLTDEQLQEIIDALTSS